MSSKRFCQRRGSGKPISGEYPRGLDQLLAEAREKLSDAENLLREVVGLRRQDKQMASQEDRIVESIATTNSTAARNVLQRKLDGQAEEAQRLQREAATEIERRIILRGFVHKVVVISTKPLALEAEIYSDFGVFRGSKFAVLPSTGSQETTRKGDFDRESLNPIGLSMPSMTEFELPLKGSRGRSRT